jgi:hypothetical protein
MSNSGILIWRREAGLATYSYTQLSTKEIVPCDYLSVDKMSSWYPFF